MKYDGYRCLLAIGGGEARTYTRSGLDWSDHFMGVIKAALTLKIDTALIDGEAVVLDAEGKSSFHALQALLQGGHADVVFYAFDLLELDKEDLASRPQIERKDRLAKIVGYTFWDYWRNAYGRNTGLRIDHLLLSPPLKKRLTAAGVDRNVRGLDKASDHAPTWIELSDAASRRKHTGRSNHRRSG
jgi:hypothetical protein